VLAALIGFGLAPGFHLGGSCTLGVLFVGVVLFVGIGALSRQNDRPYSATVFYLLLGALASVGLGMVGVARLTRLLIIWFLSM
jgi:hypothetical protein